LQLVEQHWDPSVQASPWVRQVAPVEPVGTASQVPEELMPQLPVPEQQSEGLPQAVPICRQLSARHWPAMQFSVQQSLALVHALPAGLQNWLVVQTVWPPTVFAAQVPEQQSVCPGVQAVSSATQAMEPLEQTPFVHSPSQQGFPPAVQACWSAMHTPDAGSTQVPPVQVNPEQQGFDASQARPRALHEPAPTQAPPEQVSPEQQGVDASQAAAWGAHCVSTPPPSAPLEQARERASSATERSWVRRE
jgi:hypothetical protein